MDIAQRPSVSPPAPCASTPHSVPTEDPATPESAACMFTSDSHRAGSTTHFTGGGTAVSHADTTLKPCGPLFVLFIPAPLECGGSIPSAGYRDPPSALRTSAYHCACVYVRAGVIDPSHPPVSTAGDSSNSTVGAGAASSQCTPTPLSLLRCRSASTGSGPEAGLGLDTVAAPWIDQGEFRTACGSKRCPGVPVVGLPVAWGALQTPAGGRPPPHPPSPHPPPAPPCPQRPSPRLPSHQRCKTGYAHRT